MGVGWLLFEGGREKVGLRWNAVGENSCIWEPKFEEEGDTNDKLKAPI